MLPDDDKERKSIPVYQGCFAYFARALAAVAEHSRDSNEQHNPGQPLHWDKSKSTDQLGSLARHLLDTTEPGQTLDEQIGHAKAVSWRSLAHLENLLDQKARLSQTPPAMTDEQIQNLPEYMRDEFAGNVNVHEHMRALRLRDD